MILEKKATINSGKFTKKYKKSHENKKNHKKI